MAAYAGELITARFFFSASRIHSRRRVHVALPDLARRTPTGSAPSAPTSPDAAPAYRWSGKDRDATSRCCCSATGASLTITTRFPGKDAIRRFTQLEDSAEWIDRLKIVGIDLRDPAPTMALADDVVPDGPLDRSLVNNACQTVRPTPGAYSKLVEMESAPLRPPSGSPRR